jgi:hypothetical protein
MERPVHRQGFVFMAHEGTRVPRPMPQLPLVFGRAASLSFNVFNHLALTLTLVPQIFGLHIKWHLSMQILIDIVCFI